MREIELTNGGVTIVDDEDYDFLSSFRWNRTDDLHTSYAIKCFWFKELSKRQTIGLHRFVLVCNSGLHIDHIDGNGLNNQKSNLRVCLPRQNQYNARKRIDNSVGLKGVTFVRGRYHSQIQFNEIHKFLGSFSTPEEAHLAYVEASRKLHGEFSSTDR